VGAELVIHGSDAMKACDQAELQTWVRDRGIAVRIARQGVESSQKLGTHRWVIKRSMAWLFGYRRLSTRYERYPNHFCASRLSHFFIAAGQRLGPSWPNSSSGARYARMMSV
jgi:hypothetical protein